MRVKPSLACFVWIVLLAAASEAQETNRAFPGSGWIDRNHVRISEQLDRTALWLDSRFSPRGPATGALASCSAVVGGEVVAEHDEGVNWRVRGKAHVTLPRMEDRLRLTLNNIRRDALPGVDPIEGKRDLRLGLDWDIYRTLRSLFDLEAGLRVTPALKPFIDLRLDHRRDLDGWTMAFRQSEFWNRDDRLAELTAVTFQRALNDAWLFRSTTAGKYGQETVGLESEQTLAIALRYRGGAGQVSLAASVFAERMDISNYRLRLTWRSRVLRPWFALYVIPEVNFPDEERFSAQPGIRVGFETAYE